MATSAFPATRAIRRALTFPPQSARRRMADGSQRFRPRLQHRSIFTSRSAEPCAGIAVAIPRSRSGTISSKPTVAALRHEVEQVTRLIPRRQRVQHVHFGGGTPTILQPNTLVELVRLLQQSF